MSRSSSIRKLCKKTSLAHPWAEPFLMYRLQKNLDKMNAGEIVAGSNNNNNTKRNRKNDYNAHSQIRKPLQPVGPLGTLKNFLLGF